MNFELLFSGDAMLHVLAKMPSGFVRIAHGSCLIAPLVCASPAFAEKGIILGDSIGVGVSMASGLPRLAHNSVSIRSANAVEQIHKAHDSVAFLSLGTNDAVGSIAGVSGGIGRIVEAARKSNVKLVWIGPPCVLKSWNTNVVKLDAVFKSQLAGRVTYVSVADEKICDRSLRAADGVHFTMQGYQILWSRARAAAGVEIDGKAMVADAAQGAVQKHREAKRKHHKPVTPAEQMQPANAQDANSQKSAGVARD
jgi:hypothetical protein